MSGGSARPQVSWRDTPVTSSILLVTIAIHVAGVMSSDVQAVLFEYGAQGYAEVEAGQWHRLITSAFLHSHEGSLVLWHVLANMLWLWIIGSQLEPRMGPGPFAALYIGTAFGGSVAAHAAGVGGVGASGAIFGLLGFWFAGIVRYRDMPGAREQLRAWAIMLVLMLSGPLWSWSESVRIGWEAHLGGLATGLLVGVAWVAVTVRRGQVYRSAVTAAAGAVPLVLLLTGVLPGGIWRAPMEASTAWAQDPYWSEDARADHLSRVFGDGMIVKSDDPRPATGISIDPRAFGIIETAEGFGLGVTGVEVMTADVTGARRAVAAATPRWYGIDQHGREWALEDIETAPVEPGAYLWTSEYVGDIEDTAQGVAVYVDFEGDAPPIPMQAGYLQVLVEELERAGVKDAHIRPDPATLTAVLNAQH